MGLLRSLRRQREREEARPPHGGRVINIDPVQLLVANARATFARLANPFDALYPPEVNVANFLKPSVSPSGRFRIDVRDLTPEDALRMRLQAALTGRALVESYDAFPGRYAMLTDTVTGGLIMGSGAWEQRENAPFVIRARGRVLVIGLGIGMCLLPVQGRPEVQKITVVELYPELIDLVRPQLPLNETVEVVQGDGFTWEPPAGAQYETIWIDIITDRTPIPAEGMAFLCDRFRPYLAAGGWLGVWDEGGILLDLWAESGRAFIPYAAGPGQ